MNHISFDVVSALYKYDEDTGIVYKLGIKRPIGTKHKKNSKDGAKEYLKTTVSGKFIYVHRLIWVYMTGDQPQVIDHIDGNSLNNKWANLRSVTQSINCKNQKTHSTNTSGSSGVTYRKDSNKWRARIMVNGKMISLGTFNEKQDAINARKEGEKEYGFMD
tara:strand:- start:3 stop:485 length:483 start_codon:yes stop_codon:yes gene_type:complete